MQPLPRSVVTAKPHRSLEAKGTHTIFLLTNMPRSIKPRFKRKPSSMKQRAFNRTLLTPTARTMPKAPRRYPRFRLTALWTNKAMRPPQFP